MLIRNPEHLNQIGCHINMAMFLEISVFGQGAVVLWCCGAVVLWRCGAVVLPLRKGGCRFAFDPKVLHVSLELATV